MAAGVLGAVAPAAGAYVYWTDPGVGLANSGTTLGRAGLDGGGAVNPLITGASDPTAMTVDGSHVYWVNQGTGSIGRANLDGSAANQSFIPGAGAAGIAVDASHIYWTDASRYVGRANLDGTGAVAHAIDMGVSSTPTGIAVSGGTLYVGEYGYLVSVPATGGSPTVLVTLPGTTALAYSVAVGGGYVYWSQNVFPGPTDANGVIDRIPLVGSPTPQVVIGALDNPSGIAISGTELYWADHGNASAAGAIGRAQLGSGGATNIQTSFIADAAPSGVAADALIDPTQTTVTCAPASVAVGSPSSCTALVSDGASPSVPTGTVVFSGNGSTFFSGSSSCTLTPRPGGGASCVAGAVPTNAGSQSITASYGGDPVHSASAGSASICAGTSAQCGGGAGGGGPGPGPVCKVPQLKGKSLGQARTLLGKAHCALGKVSKPHAKKHHKLGTLEVRSESPGAGATLAAGAKVSVRLVVKPARKRGHK